MPASDGTDRASARIRVEYHACTYSYSSHGGLFLFQCTIGQRYLPPDGRANAAAPCMDAERAGDYLTGMVNSFCGRNQQLHVHLGHVWRESQLCRQRRDSLYRDAIKNRRQPKKVAFNHITCSGYIRELQQLLFFRLPSPESLLPLLSLHHHRRRLPDGLSLRSRLQRYIRDGLSPNQLLSLR